MAIRYLTNLGPQSQHGVPMVPPDARPLHRKPGCELDTDGRSQLGLEFVRIDPAPGRNLIRIDRNGFEGGSDEDRAKFMLRARGVELRLILKFEQELQRACDSQLFLQP